MEVTICGLKYKLKQNALGVFLINLCLLQIHVLVVTLPVNSSTNKLQGWVFVGQRDICVNENVLLIDFSIAPRRDCFTTVNVYKMG